MYQRSAAGAGDNSADATTGGSGATVTADIPVTPGSTLYLEVGGNGRDGSVAPYSAAGGFNGGGVGGLDASGSGFKGGGGGASDLRTASCGTRCAGSAASLDSRLVIAGGGGGAGGSASAGGDAAQNGAAGSDAECGFASGDGGGGTQNAGGSGGTDTEDPTGNGADGSYGAGGAGGDDGTGGDNGGGGGGGGYYGGGGAGAGVMCGGGGGGGSSFVISGGTTSAYGTGSANTAKISISYLVPQAPMATTVTASNVSPNGATLTGVVDPEGSGTAYHFEYGSTNGYGTTTADSSAGSGTSNLNIAALIGNLSPATNYHFRLVATNANGVVDGADQTFSTPPAPPVLKPRATTSPASHVGQSGARLNGVVNPAGSRTTWFFEYGTTSAYGLQSSTRSAASGSTDISVSCAVSGLARHTTYHFRLVAANSNGSTTGADRTFTTR
ncbi:MAG: fibronectin type III domain-containing protein [Solirubrobacteraceae bacterium]